MKLWKSLRAPQQTLRSGGARSRASRPRSAAPRIEPLEERLLLNFDPIGDTTGFPWRAVVKLETRFATTPQGRIATCSGAMIDSFHVLTAAHCIYENGWPTSPVKVIPGQNGTSEPFLEAFATLAHYYTQFTDPRNPNSWQYDMALLKLDRPIGQLTNWFRYETRVASSVNSAGYPTEGSHDGRHMYRTYGTVNVLAQADNYFYSSIATSGLHFEHGQSGSPVWRYDGTNNYIEGVHWGVRGSDYYQIRINNSRYADLQRWMNDDRRGTGCPPGIRCIDGEGSGGEPGALPDLTDYDGWFHTSVASFSPFQARPGDGFRASSRVYNVGMATANNVSVAFYATANPDNPRSGYLMGRATASSVAAFGSADVNWSGTLPNIPAGRYYVGWVIDPDNAIHQYNHASHTGYIGGTLLTVLPAYQPPVAGDDAYALDQDTSLLVGAPGVLGNDRSPDGRPLTAVFVQGPLHGVVTLNRDGSFVYTPARGFYGTDTFRYRDNDGILDSNIATVTLTVRHILHPPLAMDDAFTLDEGGSLHIGAPGVLGNDRDPDGRALRAVLVSSTQRGNLALNADGSFAYTPAPGFHGTDTFRYKDNDGVLDSNIATVTLTVNHVIPPRLNDISPQSVNVGQILTFTARATDPDGDPLTYSLDPGAPEGASINSTTGVFAWTPARSQGPLTWTMTVRVSDSGTPQLSDAKGFTVTVNRLNAPPVLSLIGGKTVSYGNTLSFTVTASDSDGDALRFSLEPGAPAGASVDPATGQFNWRPTASQTWPTYDVTVRVVDDGTPRLTDTKTFTITVDEGIGAGRQARYVVAGQLSHSAGYYTNFITDAYSRYLGRRPDPTGSGYWLDQMQNHGLTDERLEAGFLGSEEYIANHGGTNRAWVIGMYQNLLGRSPAEWEVNYWVDQIAHGKSPAYVAYGFAASEEREGQRVVHNYQDYLHRTPQRWEIDYWVGQFVNQHLSNEDLIRGFVGSDENFQQHHSNIRDWLFGAYQQILRRDPDVGGYNAWLEMLRTGR